MILVILTGLTGIHSITTVSEVSVKAGDSIIIPCLYDSQYINHVKFLCKGPNWSSCSYAAKTNQPSSGKFSISDDKNQRIFTVTIKDLTDKDTDYWCAVEIDKGPDVREYFLLSVTEGTPRLYVDHQEITGFIGQNIMISCQYSNSGEVRWCRLGSSCVRRPLGSIDGTQVTINTSVPNVFTVTMSGLRTESSGWYWCATGDLQMPVHVTVNEQPTTTTLATTRPSTTSSPTPNTPDEPSASLDLKNLIISLNLLIVTVIVILFIWFMLKKHKQTKAAASATTAAEEDVTYCNTDNLRQTSSQSSYTAGDADVVYNSVVFFRTKSEQSVEANDGNVTYSTLA
ncbi:polymeric immunoglobulin receptor-like [Enoplosus armatus]|uniref:polymeric immunoglobulin receptor-like n=1 Tax=Enoplosus armatus TaxID=215367 RepID=UPI003996BE85